MISRTPHPSMVSSLKGMRVPFPPCRYPQGRYTQTRGPERDSNLIETVHDPIWLDDLHMSWCCSHMHTGTPIDVLRKTHNHE